MAEEKPKHKNVSKQYYNLPEDELQALIIRAQKHDSVAQEKLLEVFHPYFNKYIMLLYYGKLDLGFYDIRRFIGLFVPDKGLNYYLVRNKLNRDGISKVNDVVKGLVYMINRYGTEEDLRQTVHMTFLQCVERYSPKSNKDGDLIPFSAYMYNYFFYLLSRHVKELHIGQLGRKTFPLMVTNNADGDDSDNMSELDPPDPDQVEDQIGPEFIDEHWVIGETCGPPFDKLTIKERQILKWKYVDGLKASEIKRRITEHPNTTRESINRIKTFLKEELNDDA
jgi:hypothetical protein